MSFPSSWTTPPQQPDALLFERAAQRQSVLTKPAGSLGRLENVAVQLAGLQGTVTPAVDRVQISVFVGDHGICEEGVSAYPQAVTAQMIANFANGGAAISVRSEEHTSELQSRPHLVCRLLLEKKNPTAATISNNHCFSTTLPRMGKRLCCRPPSADLTVSRSSARYPPGRPARPRRCPSPPSPP